MISQKEISAYIIRLCQAAREKSLLGLEAEAVEYFIKTLQMAETPADFLNIASDIYRSDIHGNKYFAYSCLIKALEISESPVKAFRKFLLRRDLTVMISEFLVKKPDHLFHFIRSHNYCEHDLKEVAEIFKPYSNYISDPDPLMILEEDYRQAC